MAYVQLQVEQVGEITVIRFREHWIHDYMQIEEIGRELYRLVEEENRTKLVLELDGVEFLSSSVLGKLISLNGKVRCRNGFLRLCNAEPAVLDVFLVCKLDHLFDIKKTTREALATC